MPISSNKNNLWVEEWHHADQRRSKFQKMVHKVIGRKRATASPAVVQVYKSDKIERRRREKSVSNSSTIQSWQDIKDEDVERHVR